MEGVGRGRGRGAGRGRRRGKPQFFYQEAGRTTTTSSNTSSSGRPDNQRQNLGQGAPSGNRPRDVPLLVAPTGIVDIGANLAHASFQADLESVLERAKGANVQAIVITGNNINLLFVFCFLS